MRRLQTDVLHDYYNALERLKQGRSRVLPKGTRISKDTVSLEAGRGRGSIKSGRDLYADLIRAIVAAQAEQDRPRDKVRAQLNRAKADAERYRKELDESLAREISLMMELFDVRKQLQKLTGEKVVPIHRGGNDPKEASNTSEPME